MANSETEIRAVLDTTAILSHARGRVHVGELLVDIADEGAYVALPSVALLAAHADVIGDRAARARLGLLCALPAVHPLALDQSDAAEVATLVALADGDLGRAHAAWAALEYAAYFLTTEPDQAPPILTKDQIHPIPPDNP